MTATTTETTDLAVAVEHRPGSQVHLTIEAPAEEFDRAVDAALRRFATRMRIPGFRPGKAPAAMVERHLGWEAVREEAVEAMVPVLYMRAVDQAEIEPVADPVVDLDPKTVERGQPVKFSVTVMVKPEVTLGDYAAIRVEAKHTEVGDAEIDEAIDEVRRRHAEVVDVERPAQMGDLLMCVLEMRHGDEVLTAAGQERELELDPERLLNGLAEAIVGMEVGQDRSFTLLLADDYPREDLRGKEVAVTCAVKSIKERKLPAVDDALAALDNHGATVAEMREFYTKALVEQAERTDREQFEADVLTAFSEGLAVEIPDAIIDAEVDRQIRDLEYRFSSMGIPWEQYLAMSNQTNEQMRAERREGAVQRVRLELGLDALVKAENIDVDESAVEREEKRVASGQKLTAQQKRRLHQMTHVDLARQAAGVRLSEIARGEG